MKVIWFEHTGPMISYQIDAMGPSLVIEDLNPQHKMTWNVTRKELIRIGLRCIWAAIMVQAPEPPQEVGH